MAFEFLPSFKEWLMAGRLELTLAGIRSDVLQTLSRALDRFGLASRVAVLSASNFDEYYRKFNALLRRTDILWTKPSELSFYAGLGLAVVLAKPVGGHERYNRRWLREQGVALKQHAAEWLGEWLNDGTLAAAAWTGFCDSRRTQRPASSTRSGPASPATPNDSTGRASTCRAIPQPYCSRSMREPFGGAGTKKTGFLADFSTRRSGRSVGRLLPRQKASGASVDETGPWQADAHNYRENESSAATRHRTRGDRSTSSARLRCSIPSLPSRSPRTSGHRE
jgi:hypothetical protein